MKFSRHWFTSFISRHENKLSNPMPLPVDIVRVVAFISVTLSRFFAHVELAYTKYNIVHPWQVLDLCETGYTPGRDLTWKVPEGVVKTSVLRAVLLILNFRYEYRISILLRAGAHGTEYLPTAVFQGTREPILSSHGCRTKVTDLMPSGWVWFWRGDVASFDGDISHNWNQKFATVGRRGRSMDTWILLSMMHFDHTWQPRQLKRFVMLVFFLLHYLLLQLITFSPATFQFLVLRPTMWTQLLLILLSMKFDMVSHLNDLAALSYGVKL